MLFWPLKLSSILPLLRERFCQRTIDLLPGKTDSVTHMVEWPSSPDRKWRLQKMTPVILQNLLQQPSTPIIIGCLCRPKDNNRVLSGIVPYNELPSHSIQGQLYAEFVCHCWQCPILINCVMWYYLCVLRWLMRPILALNCLLQIEQERSEEESSVADALALPFRCARFCSASLILFASYSPAPLLMRPRQICTILCNLFPWLCWYVEVFKGGFEGVLVSLLLTTMGAFFNL